MSYLFYSRNGLDCVVHLFDVNFLYIKLRGNIQRYKNVASLGASEIIINPNEILVLKPRPADQQLNSDLGISAAIPRLPLTPFLRQPPSAEIIAVGLAYTVCGVHSSDPTRSTPVLPE